MAAKNQFDAIVVGRRRNGLRGVLSPRASRRERPWHRTLRYSARTRFERRRHTDDQAVVLRTPGLRAVAAPCLCGVGRTRRPHRRAYPRAHRRVVHRPRGWRTDQRFAPRRARVFDRSSDADATAARAVCGVRDSKEPSLRCSNRTAVSCAARLPSRRWPNTRCSRARRCTRARRSSVGTPTRTVSKYKPIVELIAPINSC